MKRATAGESQLPQAVTVDGARIRYAVTGAVDGPTVLLVHGHGANNMWWLGMLPQLEPTCRVVRIDLSGHGESDHRSGYTPMLWVREIRAVLDASSAPPAVLVGHSMGGKLAMLAAADDRESRLAGLVVMDAAVHENQPDRPRPAPGRPRAHPNVATAASRFRLVPDQPVVRPELLAAVARSLVGEVDGGWGWTRDLRGLPSIPNRDVFDAVRQIRPPFLFLYGEHSAMVGADVVDLLRTSAPHPVEIHMIPGTHHHLQVEKPEQCASLITSFVERVTVDTTVSTSPKENHD